MTLRDGKKTLQVVLKEETIQIIDEIAKKELTSKSAIAGRIIEDNIKKYISDQKETT